MNEEKELSYLTSLCAAVPKILLDIFLKLMKNNCLYWLCYLDLDKSLINKLIELGALPKVNFLIKKRQKFIHAGSILLSMQHSRLGTSKD